MIWTLTVESSKKIHFLLFFFFFFFFFLYGCHASHHRTLKQPMDIKLQLSIIIIMSQYQHGYPWPSLATPPYRPLLQVDLQGYIPYRHRAAECRLELVVLPLLVHVKGVHRSTSLMSSSPLLQQCPACLVRLIFIVFVMGGRWPYSSCFVGCWLQDLFNIASSILVKLLSSFFSIRLVVAYIYILDTYRRNDNRRMINDRRTNKGRMKEDAGRLLYNYIYLSIYCKGSKGLFKVCMWEGAGDRT